MDLLRSMLAPSAFQGENETPGGPATKGAGAGPGPGTIIWGDIGIPIGAAGEYIIAPAPVMPPGGG
jgi:hypothetical protein